MANRQLPTQDRLRQLLRYDAATGKLFWLARDAREFSDDMRLTAVQKVRAYNGRNAEREAFTASDGRGYLQGQVDGYHTTAHRVAWAWVHGEWPPEIDHIDGNRANNRLTNLRSVTRSENNKNGSRPAKGGMGVRCRRGRWEAYISIDGRTRSLGTFSTEQAARWARDEAEKELGFHPNHGKPRVYGYALG